MRRNNQSSGNSYQDVEDDLGPENTDDQSENNFDRSDQQNVPFDDEEEEEFSRVSRPRPEASNQAHWARFNKSPPMHSHIPSYAYNYDEDDSDLDKLDEARNLGQPVGTSLPMFSYWKVIAASLLIVLVLHTLRAIYWSGLHRTIYDHAPGSCRRLNGVIGGSEDIVTLPDGLAFISSGYASHATDRGRIYTYKYDSDQVSEVKFTDDFDKFRFYPHGLGVWQNPETGDIIVYCVNHHELGDRIEKFRYNRHSNTMEHIMTVLDQTITFANDIAPIDDERFYFTNTFYSTNKNFFGLEVFLMLSWGTVVYYDGEKGTVVNRAFLPNGITLSSNKEYLYTINPGNQEVRVFKRNPDDGTLDFLQAYVIESGLDNANLDPASGDLWIAGQNSISEFLAHEQNPVLPCGSRVFKIQTEDGGRKLTTLTEKYASSGVHGQSCASVASYHNGWMLIGAVRKGPILCQVMF